MYFETCKTKDEIKNRYRILSKRLHPDVGGDETIMKEINFFYEEAIEIVDEISRKVNESETYKSKHKNEKNPVHDDDEKNEYVDKIADVMEWSKTNEKFDKTFILSILERINKRLGLSESQEKSIDNIIRSFRIKPEKYQARH